MIECEKVFLLFSNCVPVRGVKRTAICDLIKGEIHLVSNELFSLFSNNAMVIKDVLSTLNDEDHDTFFEFIKFLEEKNLGFWCEEQLVNLFPPLSMEWDYCSSISNCVIDVGDDMQYFNDDLIHQLEELQCYYLQLRFFEIVEISYLLSLMNLIKESKIKSIEIIIKFSFAFGFIDNLISLIQQHAQLSSIFVHSSPDSDTFANRVKGWNIYFFEQAINDTTHCGNIDPSYFSINTEMFTESKVFNNCLNRKISIDRNRQIKNCPSMNDTYGSITNVRLKDVVNSETFKRIWKVGKDQINVCNQCEFRYVCSDCRAYLEDPLDIYSKPLKCGYNPLTCEWSEWSDSLLKKNAIEYYSKANDKTIQ